MSKSYRHSNPELMYAMQEKRRSNATVPHKNRKRYDRTAAKRELAKAW